MERKLSIRELQELLKMTTSNREAGKVLTVVQVVFGMVFGMIGFCSDSALINRVASSKVIF